MNPATFRRLRPLRIALVLFMVVVVCIPVLRLRITGDDGSATNDLILGIVVVVAGSALAVFATIQIRARRYLLRARLDAQERMTDPDAAVLLIGSAWTASRDATITASTGREGTPGSAPRLLVADSSGIRIRPVDADPATTWPVLAWSRVGEPTSAGGPVPLIRLPLDGGADELAVIPLTRSSWGKDAARFGEVRADHAALAAARQRYGRA